MPMLGRVLLMPGQRDARLVANHAPVGHGAAAAHRPRTRMRRPGMRARNPVMRMRNSVVRVGGLAVRMTGLAMRDFVVRMTDLVVRTRGPMMAERDPAVRGPHPRHRRERRRRLGFGLRLGRRRRRKFGRGLLLRWRGRLSGLLRVRGPSETSKRERCAHHHGTVHDPLHRFDDSRVRKAPHPVPGRAQPTRCTACPMLWLGRTSEWRAGRTGSNAARALAVASIPAIVQLRRSSGEGTP
jgi:hypothetical protein